MRRVGDAVCSRRQPAAEVELRQPRDDANENLLRGVFGVFAMAAHAQCEAEDAVLEMSDELFERFATAL